MMVQIDWRWSGSSTCPSEHLCHLPCDKFSNNVAVQQPEWPADLAENGPPP